MEHQKSISKNVVATISAVTLAAIAIGGGLAWWTIDHSNHPVVSTPSKIPVTIPVTIDPAKVNPQTATQIPTAPETTTTPPISITPNVGETNTKTTTPPKIAQKDSTVKIWRLDDDGKKTILVPQEQQAPQATETTPAAGVTRSISTLLASSGKPDGKLTSTIPVGTKLLSTKVLADGIHIDLSKEFTQGFGATSMIGRLGQIVYTATAENPSAPVWITVEGKKLEVLGDVGVEVRQPVTRETYDRDFPINPASSTTP
ncbi:GerMN domain-containing protein [Chamaesiphon sp. GL140_3_metabinner_50]|uniref:GerMN domain-containing protein n=1 Tax=Chamaesiphon sp. GL140_3_metabinner_50 TaxID=2970812 RepID=UPI0025E268FB|nr:GerMN domain-containing protein [Chamaesiphon sp. GL140_3_metabinner_50]